MKKHLIKVVLLFILLSCNKTQKLKSEESEYISDTGKTLYAMEIPPPPPPPKSSTIQKDAIQDQNQPKKVIYTADIKYRVAAIKESEQKIKSLVNEMKGYISNSRQNNTDGNLNTTLTIRIPVEKLDVFMAGSEKESIFTDYKNLESEDVSEEYYDNETRLKSKRTAFEKYLSLIKQAKNVTEVMAVEEQIRIIQEEIDSKEGRQKFINNQVAFSTVTIHIYQIIPNTAAPGLPIFTQIWQQFIGGIHSFINLIIGLFYFIPYLISIFLVIFLFKKWRKSSK
jgi:Domain of unknown function (DUF4349)